VTAENSTIEWCDHTFNPWEGCQKVGPGCDNCYAEARDLRFTGGTHWGPNAPRRLTSQANWAKPIKWNREAAASGARPRVFCASLADVFDNAVDPAWREDLWRLIAATPNLDWLLLTKRPSNIGKMLPTFAHWGNGWPNVWLGCTVVNQSEVDRDIPKLLAIPAAVRFLSIEPLLGPVDLRFAFSDIRTACCHKCGFRTNAIGGTCSNDGTILRGDIGIDWVIVGGESGPHARPMHPDWARSLRDQCAAAAVPFLFKQWGEWAPSTPEEAWLNPRSGWRCLKGHPHVPRAEELYPENGAAFIERKGKKAAGRLLDGVEHNGFPEVQREAGNSR
jgi:protein gp37